MVAKPAGVPSTAGTPKALIAYTKTTTSAESRAGRSSGRVIVRKASSRVGAARSGRSLEIGLDAAGERPGDDQVGERGRRHGQDDNDPERAVEPGQGDARRPGRSGRAARTPAPSRTRSRTAAPAAAGAAPARSQRRPGSVGPLGQQRRRPSRTSPPGRRRAPPVHRLFQIADRGLAARSASRPRSRAPRSSATPNSRATGQPMMAAARPAAASQAARQPATRHGVSHRRWRGSRRAAPPGARTPPPSPGRPAGPRPAARRRMAGSAASPCRRWRPGRGRTGRTRRATRRPVAFSVASTTPIGLYIAMAPSVGHDQRHGRTLGHGGPGRVVEGHADLEAALGDAGRHLVRGLDLDGAVRLERGVEVHARRRSTGRSSRARRTPNRRSPGSGMATASRYAGSARSAHDSGPGATPLPATMTMLRNRVPQYVVAAVGGIDAGGLGRLPGSQEVLGGVGLDGQRVRQPQDVAQDPAVAQLGRDPRRELAGRRPEDVDGHARVGGGVAGDDRVDGGLGDRGVEADRAGRLGLAVGLVAARPDGAPAADGRWRWGRRAARCRRRPQTSSGDRREEAIVRRAGTVSGRARPDGKRRRTSQDTPGAKRMTSGSACAERPASTLAGVRAFRIVTRWRCSFRDAERSADDGLGPVVGDPPVGDLELAEGRAAEEVELAAAQPVAHPAPVQRDPFARPERVEEADPVDRAAGRLEARFARARCPSRRRSAGATARSPGRRRSRRPGPTGSGTCRGARAAYRRDPCGAARPTGRRRRRGSCGWARPRPGSPRRDSPSPCRPACGSDRGASSRRPACRSCRAGRRRASRPRRPGDRAASGCRWRRR